MSICQAAAATDRQRLTLTRAANCAAYKSIATGIPIETLPAE